MKSEDVIYLINKIESYTGNKCYFFSKLESSYSKEQLMLAWSKDRVTFLSSIQQSEQFSICIDFDNKSLTGVEIIWLKRFVDFLNKYKVRKILSWWLIIEHDKLIMSPTKINKILTDVSNKLIVKKENHNSYIYLGI